MKAVLENHDALTESQEENILWSASNKDDTMADNDAMRSGRAANEINVAEESDDEDKAGVEACVDAGDNTTGTVQKVKETKAHDKQISNSTLGYNRWTRDSIWEADKKRIEAENIKKKQDDERKTRQEAIHQAVN
jgi:hypothetical protein